MLNKNKHFWRGKQNFSFHKVMFYYNLTRAFFILNTLIFDISVNLSATFINSLIKLQVFTKILI